MQHAEEIRGGKQDHDRMAREIQDYISQCEEEEYLTRIKDIKIRPSDATSNLSKRAFTTLGGEDDSRFYEYEQFLKELHQGWKQTVSNIRHGKGDPLHHIPGTFIKEDGTWYHELEGT